MVKKNIVIAVFLVFGYMLKSQNPGDMIVDKKSRTVSAIVLTKGVLHIESGFHYDGDQELGVKTSSINLNTTLLRFGISDGVELRIETGYSRLSVSGNTVSGLEPVKFGFKSKIADRNNKSPDIALIFAVAPANTGSENFSNKKWEFDFIGAFDWRLPKELNLGSNIGIVLNGGSGDFVIPVTTVLGFPLDYHWGGFFELSGEFINEQDPRFSAAIGVTYNQNNDLQFDAYIGKGINDAAIDWFFGFGLSWRLGPLFR